MILAHLTQQAIRAHNGTSFSPEKRGASLIQEFSEELESDLKRIADLGTKYNQDPAAVMASYRQRYEKHLSSWLSSKSNCISSMIAGPSKFPVQRAEKYNRWEENKYKFFRDWRDKVLRLIEKGFKPTETPLTELDRAKKDLDIRLRNQERMKQVNAIIRKAKGEDCTKELMNIGIPVADAIKLQIPGFGGKGFPAYMLTNNNANIRRLEQRVKELQTKAERHQAKEEVDKEVNGIIIKENYELDRVQIFFPGKPESQMIQKLKANGWRWSPSSGSWQRKLTAQAKSDAAYLIKN